MYAPIPSDVYAARPIYRVEWHILTFNTVSNLAVRLHIHSYQDVTISLYVERE